MAFTTMEVNPAIRLATCTAPPANTNTRELQIGPARPATPPRRCTARRDNTSTTTGRRPQIPASATTCGRTATPQPPPGSTADMAFTTMEVNPAIRLATCTAPPANTNTRELQIGPARPATPPRRCTARRDNTSTTTGRRPQIPASATTCGRTATQQLIRGSTADMAFTTMEVNPAIRLATCTAPPANTNTRELQIGPARPATPPRRCTARRDNTSTTTGRRPQIPASATTCGRTATQQLIRGSTASWVSTITTTTSATTTTMSTAPPASTNTRRARPSAVQIWPETFVIPKPTCIVRIATMSIIRFPFAFGRTATPSTDHGRTARAASTLTTTASVTLSATFTPKPSANSDGTATARQLRANSITTIQNSVIRTGHTAYAKTPTTATNTPTSPGRARRHKRPLPRRHPTP